MTLLFRKNNRCKLFILSSLISIFSFSNAQLFNYKGVFSKPYKDRTIETAQLRMRLTSTYDKDSVDREIGYINEVAKELNNQDIAKEAVLIQMFCYNNNNWGQPKERIKNIEDVIDHIKPTDKNNYLKIYGMTLKAEVYWDKLKEYDRFFEIYEELIEFVKNISQDEYPDLVEVYRRLGNGYYFFGDYANAIRYIKIGTNFPQTKQNFAYMLHCYNGIGLCYQKQNKLDSADYYFNKMLALEYNPRKDQFDGIAYGNLGNS